MYSGIDRLDLARVLRSLRQKVERSDLRPRDIERRLGLSRGYLARLLSGKAEIRLWQILGLLEILGEFPSRFFREHFPAPEPQPPKTEGRADAGDAERRAEVARRLRVNREIVGVYGLGIESIRELSERLERCELALRAVEKKNGDEPDELDEPDEPDPDQARARS